MENKKITIALAGNPNAGKTSLFNAITGAKQKTGNYPGVTVEKKEGKKIYKNYEVHLIDLPGTYSLTAYSIDEIVARDFLINEKPDIIIDVLDSTNIERNLFLCLQFQELGIPVVGALNMNDQAEANGIKIDEKKLSEILRITLIKTVGSTGKGSTALLDEAIRTKELNNVVETAVSYGSDIEKEVRKIIPLIKKDEDFSAKYPIHWLSIKLIEKDAEAIRILNECSQKEEVISQVNKSITWLEAHFGMDSEIAVSEQRYGYIHGAVKEAVKKDTFSRINVTEAVDKILINRFLGPVFFVAIIWAIFQLTFVIGEYPMAWLEAFFSMLSNLGNSTITNEFARSLIVDGIIAGVGGVMSFVPLIIILFFFISLLEDTGYMSRAAFVMDKFLHIFGLHGQSFMPLIIGFGCSVPAIMAARTLKSPKDRIVTILVTPFMSCGAKLPVYVLLTGAFFSHNAGNVILSIYISGVILALFFSTILRRTVLKGKVSPFVMELPPYRMPTLQGVGWHVWSKTGSYIKKAGTIILAASIIIWVITSFPKLPENDSRASTEADIQHNEAMLANKALEHSFAGRLGKIIEPVVKPLGFDWRVGISAITGFAAKEVVVSTLGVLYSVGLEEGEDSESLREALQNDKGFTPLTAYVLMLFTLILAPCFATLAVIRSELGWKWLGFAILYTSISAWVICFVVYQIGSLLGLGV